MKKRISTHTQSPLRECRQVPEALASSHSLTTKVTDAITQRLFSRQAHTDGITHGLFRRQAHTDATTHGLFRRQAHIDATTHRCVSCSSSCGPGSQVSDACNATHDTTCEVCPIGTYKNSTGRCRHAHTRSLFSIYFSLSPHPHLHTLLLTGTLTHLRTYAHNHTLSLTNAHTH